MIKCVIVDECNVNNDLRITTVGVIVIIDSSVVKIVKVNYRRSDNHDITLLLY